MFSCCLWSLCRKVKVWKYFLWITRALQNHWTNTRLVCTHLNAFFKLIPKMAMKIWMIKIKWILTICEKNLENLVCLQTTPTWRGLKSVDENLYQTAMNEVMGNVISHLDATGQALPYIWVIKTLLIFFIDIDGMRHSYILLMTAVSKVTFSEYPLSI